MQLIHIQSTYSQPSGAHSIPAQASGCDPTRSSGQPPPSGASSCTAARWEQLKGSTSTFVLNNFMLLSFSLAAALAMAWPLPGRVVASWSVGDVRVVQAINNFMVFLISGLTLKSDDFR